MVVTDALLYMEVNYISIKNPRTKYYGTWQKMHKNSETQEEIG